MNLTYKFRLLPTRPQHRALRAILDDQRELYNAALEERISAYRATGKSRSYFDQCKGLTELRADKRWAGIPANIQRGTLKRLDLAYRSFFRRVKAGGKPGFPRFKGRNWFTSFAFSEFSGIRFDGGKLRFKGMPGALRVHMHRPVPLSARFLGVRFKRDPKGWTVSLCVAVDTPPKGTVTTACGIDVGLKALVFTSDGLAIPNPRTAWRAARGLRVRQRALARCKRGSYRRRKVKARLARLHMRIANGRATKLHQISAMLVGQYDLIAAEALSVKGLAVGMLARSVNDAAWAKLFQMIAYKAEKAGGHFIQVDPKNTTQECSGCGVIVRKRLGERVHDCPSCGLVLDRDHNAAINILRRAVVRPGAVNVAQLGRASAWKCQESLN